MTNLVQMLFQIAFSKMEVAIWKSVWQLEYQNMGILKRKLTGEKILPNRLSAKKKSFMETVKKDPKVIPGEHPVMNFTTVSCRYQFKHIVFYPRDIMRSIVESH